jgi:hypothetical protein
MDYMIWALTDTHNTTPLTRCTSLLSTPFTPWLSNDCRLSAVVRSFFIFSAFPNTGLTCIRQKKMGQHTYLAPVFIALLALGGQIGLPILVLTFLRSKKLNRRSTFVNFCITLIIYSLAFSLL